MLEIRSKSSRMEFLLLYLCLLTVVTLGQTNGPGVVREVVTAGSDVVLPCSLSTKENIELGLFDWRKDDQKEVFLYQAGLHYNNGRGGQDEQFKGRVSHFPEELKNGNASIMIRNTKKPDSGNYTCYFPRLQPRTQKFSIELVVGTTSEPNVRTVDGTKDWSLLQCDVRGASPKPEVKWQDSDGNVLPAEEPQVTERDGSYDIILKTNVTKTDRFRCVVQQREIGHSISAQTFVFVDEKQCDNWLVWFSGGLLFGATLFAAVQTVLIVTKCIIISRIKGSPKQKKRSCNGSAQVPFKMAFDP